MQAIWPFPESTRKVLEDYFQKPMEDADAILYQSTAYGAYNYRLEIILENGHSWAIMGTYHVPGLDELNAHIEKVLREQGMRYRKVTRVMLKG